jgi:hypothetical protein
MTSFRENILFSEGKQSGKLGLTPIPRPGKGDIPVFSRASAPRVRVSVRMTVPEKPRIRVDGSARCKVSRIEPKKKKGHLFLSFR